MNRGSSGSYDSGYAGREIGLLLEGGRFEQEINSCVWALEQNRTGYTQSNWSSERKDRGCSNL